ncbi:unnamed protein product [Allacma fusca]|uniref:Complex 1 LYR protein domain-containing protein n=1 Tax=Allacma fusca TaxID=39272 RepID=A0A8J2LJB5_9HEXA|nr:unnamed protein product [Allacma fusca]
MAQRMQVRGLYRRILRLGQTWVSKSGDTASTTAEKDYIKKEAQALFRKNGDLTDSQAIADCIREAEARIEIALHYQIPYPRPVNVPPLSMARRLGKEQGIVQERMKKQSKPIYVKSFD